MPAGVVARLNFILINDGTNLIQLADFLREARITNGPDAVEDTSMSDAGHTSVPGLLNPRIRGTIKMGYGDGSPEEVLWNIISQSLPIAVEARPTGASISVDNPAYRFGNPSVSPVVLGAYITGPDIAFMGGRVGELVESPFEISPGSGTSLVRVTS